MLTTGFRSVLGIKVFGPDLATIQTLGVAIEKALTDLPDTRSVFAERTTGGYFLDFTPRREAAARYGLTVGDVNDVVETAVGGTTVTTTVEGRERYPVNVRYARDYRSDLEALRRVLVPAPTGAQVPIGELADVSYRTGPPDIREENGQLVGFVFVDVTTDNIDGYVQAANARLAGRVNFPAGCYMQWAGQFEYLKSAEQRLRVVVPFTLLVIFVLIYLNTRSAARTAIVLLAVPFSLVGAFWLLYLLHYNFERGRLGRIDRARRLGGRDGGRDAALLGPRLGQVPGMAGRLATASDLREAIIEGAVGRVRPKIMTVCAIPFAAASDHVVAGSPGPARGRDEAHRGPDDRRRPDLGDFGTSPLSGHLHALAPSTPALTKQSGAHDPGLAPVGREHGTADSDDFQCINDRRLGTESFSQHGKAPNMALASSIGF